MAYRTGLLVLHAQTAVNSILLSKILASALQKIEQTLYLQVSDLKYSYHEANCASYNGIINQIYLLSLKKAPHIDTRVILRDFRDLLLGDQGLSESFHRTRAVNLLMSDGRANTSALHEHLKPQEEVTIRAENGNIEEAQIGHHKAVQEISNKAPETKIYENVVLGGTFDRLHAGHKMLLSAAILRCSKKLTIGVTDGPMIKTKKLYELIEPCETRIEKLKEFLQDVEPRLEYRIVPITDPYGPTAEDPNLQMLVVSEETLKGGYKVNELRKENGLSILDIHQIGLIEDVEATKDEESKVSSSSYRKRLLGTHLKPPKAKSRPYVIGLTGGIASGKTSICTRLKNFGAAIVSCDHLGHQAYKKGTKCYEELLEYFGNSIVDDNGEIDRKKLGPVVFADKVHLTKLNSIVWPEIRRLYLDEIERLKAEGFNGVIVLDAAILLEAGWDRDCNEVWVSIVPPSEAIKRIMDRDKLPPEQATKRIESQLSNSDRVAKGNVIFCTVWEPEVTGKQVETAWQQVQEFLNASD